MTLLTSSIFGFGHSMLFDEQTDFIDFNFFKTDVDLNLTQHH
ncbi:hypothetical protein ACQCVP_21005 [Rossellomorea vietnamensis]